MKDLHLNFISKCISLSPTWNHVLVPNKVNEIREDLFNVMYSLTYVSEAELFSDVAECIQAVGRVYRYFYLTDEFGYRKLFDSLGDRCLQLGSKKCEADARRIVGDFCRIAGEKHIAVAAYERASKLYSAINDVCSVSHCLSALISVSPTMQQKIEAAEQVQRLCTHSGDYSAVPWYDYRLAAEASSLGDKVTSILYYEKAIKGYESQKNRSEIMLCFSSLSQIHMLSSNFEAEKLINERWNSYMKFIQQDQPRYQLPVV